MASDSRALSRLSTSEEEEIALMIRNPVTLVRTMNGPQIFTAISAPWGPKKRRLFELHVRRSRYLSQACVTARETLAIMGVIGISGKKKTAVMKMHTTLA